MKPARQVTNISEDEQLASPGDRYATVPLQNPKGVAPDDQVARPD
jgi:hypothetical protein